MRKKIIFIVLIISFFSTAKQTLTVQAEEGILDNISKVEVEVEAPLKSTEGGNRAEVSRSRVSSEDESIKSDDFEQGPIVGDWREDSRYSINIHNVTHYSIGAAYTMRRQEAQVSLQHGGLLPPYNTLLTTTTATLPVLTVTRLITGLEAGSDNTLRWGTIQTQPITHYEGITRIIRTAGRAELSQPEELNITANSAHISQSINTNANDSQYKPQKFEVKVKNHTTGNTETLTYTSGLQLFDETDTQFTTEFELTDLTENTEYTVSTVLTTGDGTTENNSLVSEPSDSFTFRTSEPEALEISTQSIEVLLGTANRFDPRRLIREVKIGDRVLSPNEYTCTLLNPTLFTQAAGDAVAQIRIDYQQHTEIVTVPVTVKWGSSIQLFGTTSDSSPPERTVGAYPWHSGVGISYAPGTLDHLSTSVIPPRHDFFSEVTSRVAVFSGTQDVTIGDTGVNSFTARPYESPNQLLVNFRNAFSNNDGFIPAEIGDVVESYHIYQNNATLTGTLSASSGRIWQGLRTDEDFTDPTGGLNNVYYEITEEGFRPLMVNQTIGVDSEISQSITNEQLEETIADFVELPTGVSAVRFETYPDRTPRSISEGKILVEETLQSGRNLKYLVSVNFAIVAEPIVVTFPVSMLFHSNNLTGQTVAITSANYEIKNRSLIPVDIEIDSITNPRHIDRISNLYMQSSENTFEKVLVSNGTMMNLTNAQALKILPKSVEQFFLRGTATNVSGELNPYFEFNFKVSASL